MARRELEASRRVAFAAFALALAWPRSAEAAKIACVGDSITFGYNLSDPSTQSYPAVLGARLGSADTVQNFGVSGTTLLKSGDKPYWNETNFTASTSFAPDVVVIMLGTNDAKPQNWSNKAEFSPDYLDLIAHYRALGALVYVAAPPPVYPPGAYDIPPDVVANEVVPLVETIAARANAPLIDVFTALSGKADDFPDTVHPNVAGAALIADTVQASLELYGFGGAGTTAGAGGASTTGGSGGAALGGNANGAGASGTEPNGGAAPSSGGTSGGARTVTNGAGGAAQAGSSATGRGGGSTGGRGASSAETGGSTSGGSGVPSSSAGAPGLGGAGVAGAAPPPVAGASGSTPSAANPPSGGGCGCRASGSGSPGPVGALLVFAAIAFARRRRCYTGDHLPRS